MNVIGTIIFCVIGIAIIKTRKLLFNEETIDYSQYPSTIGTVCGECGRWVVRFNDLNGREVLGMDDMILYGTFYPNKYNLPKRGTQEKIYFWKYDLKSKYSINKQKIEYYIHFCNESFYDLKRRKEKTHSIMWLALGIFFIVCGILIFFKV